MSTWLTWLPALWMRLKIEFASSGRPGRVECWRPGRRLGPGRPWDWAAAPAAEREGTKGLGIIWVSFRHFRHSRHFIAWQTKKSCQGTILVSYWQMLGPQWSWWSSRSGDDWNEGSCEHLVWPRVSLVITLWPGPQLSHRVRILAPCHQPDVWWAEWCVVTRLTSDTELLGMKPGQPSQTWIGLNCAPHRSMNKPIVSFVNIRSLLSGCWSKDHSCNINT